MLGLITGSSQVVRLRGPVASGREPNSSGLQQLNTRLLLFGTIYETCVNVGCLERSEGRLVSEPAAELVFHVQLRSCPTVLAATEPAEAVCHLRALCVWKRGAGRGDGSALSRSSKIPLKHR